MQYGDAILFWREKVKFSDQPGGLATVELESVPAKYIGESEPICAVCRDREEDHATPKRVHPFEAVITGITIEVQYSDEKKELRHNVQQGESANCWTEA